MHRLFPFLILWAAIPALRAADDDPEYAGRKASEYIALLHKLAQDVPADPQAREASVEKRRRVLSVLELMGPEATRVRAGVVKCLQGDPDEGVRETAARWFGQVAVKAREGGIDLTTGIVALSGALKTDKSAAVREAAAKALDMLAQARVDLREALPALAAALKDAQPGPRAAAAKALGSIGLDAIETVPALLEALKDRKGDRFTRSYAALAVMRIGARDEVVVTALAQTFADTEAPRGVREDVARTLRQLGKDAVPAVPVLAAALKEKDVDVRRAAVGALAEIGQEARSALPALRVAAVGDEDKSVRCQAIQAIGGFGPEAVEAVPDLVDCLKETIAEVRLAAVRALGAIGPGAKPAKAALELVTQDTQSDIREAAQEALKRIDGQS